MLGPVSWTAGVASGIEATTLALLLHMSADAHRLCVRTDMPWRGKVRSYEALEGSKRSVVLIQHGQEITVLIRASIRNEPGTVDLSMDMFAVVCLTGA